MVRKNIVSFTSIVCNESTEGELIEQKVFRMIENKEPITDGSEIAYSERKDGVIPGSDIRTDRFDAALDAMDKVRQLKQDARDLKGKTEEKKEEKPPEKPAENGGTEPLPA